MGPVHTLFLLRHAKSSWSEAGRPDRDRPLAPRGQRAIVLLVDDARAHGVRPDLVLCSPARRTRETLEALRPALGSGVDVRFDDDLYGADAAELLDRLRAVGEDVGSVMVVGHNPGLHDLAVGLAGYGESLRMEQLRAKLPTGALVTLELGDTAWAELGPGEARLARLVYPRELPDG